MSAEQKRTEPSNIVPEIIYNDAPAAPEWLARVFGFIVGQVIREPDGTIPFAEMYLGTGTIMPKSPMSETDFGHSPRTLGGVTGRLYVVVDDPDAHYAHARTAGAEIVMEPFDTDYGARLYSVRDLEGHLWSFGTYRPGEAAEQ